MAPSSDAGRGSQAERLRCVFGRCAMTLDDGLDAKCQRGDKCRNHETDEEYGGPRAGAVVQPVASLPRELERQRLDEGAVVILNSEPRNDDAQAEAAGPRAKSKKTRSEQNDQQGECYEQNVQAAAQ